MNAIAPYRKTVMAVLGAVASWLSVTYTGESWVTLVVGVLTALGVYASVNEPAHAAAE